jgi:alpha-glucosidase
MNYDAFMEPLTFFLTGMEKHSDFKRDDLRQDGQMFQRRMRECMARFDWPSLLSAMNELSNHDHSRFLTRTNRTIGRVESAGSQAAGANIDKRVFREAVAVQMTWPGAPTIYYADEAGQVGWTDPDCRRTYPWGNEDWGLIELHRVLAGIRGEHPSLRTGSFLPLGGGGGWIAFGRFQDADRMVTVCNNSSSGQRIRLRLRGLGAPDGAEAVQCLVTTDTGFRTERTVLAQVESGYVDLDLPGRSALVFELRDPA